MCFFNENICVLYAGYALSFSETAVSSDAALLKNAVCDVTLKTTFFSNSPEATSAKCCKYTLFLYKNTFFSKNICVFAFFVVPLHPIFAHSGGKGAIVYRLGQEIFIL